MRNICLICFVFLLCLPKCKTNNPYIPKLKHFNISILTYNVWALPISLYKHDHFYRFPKIPHAVKNIDADIVCLQETFHPKLRTNLINVLGDKYETESDYWCNQVIIPFIIKDCQGGLMTLSKYPILSEQFYQFPRDEKYSLIEYVGAKGFLITKINVNGSIIYVINTHLYAGNNKHAEMQRGVQIDYINHIINKEMNIESYPIFLVGDINIHHPDVSHSPTYSKITNDMGFNDTKINVNENDYTSDCKYNSYVQKEEPRSKLDYIFYKSNNQSQVIKSNRCLDQKPLLSDHLGWLSYIKIIE